MRGGPGLSPEKAVLLLVGAAMLALMGVPGLGTYEPPFGAVVGIVTNADGQVVADAEVALFDRRRLALVEITRADDRGRFGFGHAPAQFELFASTDAEGYAGAWARVGDERLPRATVRDFALVLPSARTTNVVVSDPAGDPVPGAEVRVLRAGASPAVLDRCLTDEGGSALVRIPTAPGAALVAVFGPNGAAERWLDVPEPVPAGSALEVRLPVAHGTTGVVRDRASAPVAGLTVSAWDDAPATQTTPAAFGGWTTTDADGRFALSTTEQATRLRITDATGKYVGRIGSIEPGETGELELVVEPGRPLDLAVSAPGASEDARAPMPSVVWVLPGPEFPWSSAARTDGAGRLTVRVPPMASPSIVVQPLGTGAGGHGRGRIESWDRTPGETEVQLEVRPVEEE